jgi:hypothetical protein
VNGSAVVADDDAEGIVGSGVGLLGIGVEVLDVSGITVCCVLPAVSGADSFSVERKNWAAAKERELQIQKDNYQRIMEEKQGMCFCFVFLLLLFYHTADT